MLSTSDHGGHKYPSWQSSEIVTIDLSEHPPSTPLGMLLAPGTLPRLAAAEHSFHEGGHPSTTPPWPLAGSAGSAGSAGVASATSATSSNVTLVAGWEHVAGKNGGSGSPQLGPIQRSGLVRLGDRLVRINAVDVAEWTFREVMDALKNLMSSSRRSRRRSNPLRSLSFAPSGTLEWYRGTNRQGLANPESAPFVDKNYSSSRASWESGSGGVVHSKRLYSFTSCIGRWRLASASDHDQSAKSNHNTNNDPNNHSNNDSNNKSNGDPSNESNNCQPSSKPYIQYQIECHLSFHDIHSLNALANAEKLNDHYSWTVWKRYSEFQSLHTTLRQTFAWQMDALNDTGIVFPSSHGLETWWYGLQTSSFLTGFAKADSSNESKAGNSGAANSSITSNISNGLSALLPSLGTDKPAKSTDTSKFTDIANTSDVTQNDTLTINASHQTTPVPETFVQKRQKELSTYWNNLMRIEDIFEFSDCNSHRYGTVMASFLQLNEILACRRGSLSGVQSQPHQLNSLQPHDHPDHSQHQLQHYPQHSLRESSHLRSTMESILETEGIASNRVHDDDDSTLSDETQRELNFLPVGFQPTRANIMTNVVDVVPDGTAGVVARGTGITSVTDGSHVTSGTDGGTLSGRASMKGSLVGRRTPRRNQSTAKPAFQRQFLLP